MKDRLLCIELTSYEIKVCDIEYDKKKNHVKLISHFNIPVANNITDTEILASDELAYNLKENLQKNKITTKKCIVSINSKQIVGRSLTVPYQKTSQQLLEVITAKVEADDIFPAVDLNSSILTYSILDQIDEEVVEQEVDEEENSTKNGGSKKPKINVSYNVMAYVAPKKLITDVTDLIHACNLDLISIDYAGNSVYQFVRKNFSSGTYLAVHINDVNTIMTVIQDGILVAQKIDDFSYNTIARKLIERQDITGVKTVKDALKYINDTNFFDEDYLQPEDLSETQADSLYYLRKEIIEYTIDFFDIIKSYLASMRRDYNISSIIYINNSATFPDLSDSIRENVGSEITKIDEDYFGYKVSLLNCICSCIAPINFNIEKTNQIEQRKKIKQYGIVALVLTCWFCVLYTGFNVYTLQSYKAKNTKLKAQIADAQEAQKIYEEYQTSVSNLDILNDFEEKNNGVLADVDVKIDDISNCIPTGKLYVTNFACTTETINIAVTADSKDSVSFFIENLEKLGYFDKVECPSISETKADTAGGEASDFASGRTATANVVCYFPVTEDTEDTLDSIYTDTAETSSEGTTGTESVESTEASEVTE